VGDPKEAILRKCYKKLLEKLKPAYYHRTKREGFKKPVLILPSGKSIVLLEYFYRTGLCSMGISRN
jgi:hypothetical protein